MKKLLSFLIVGFILFSIKLNAQKQNWRKSIFQSNSNYFEIVENNKARLLPLRGKKDRTSKKKIKQFERWASFWHNRIKPDGSFVSAYHNYNEWVEDNRRQLQKRNGTGGSTPWTLVGPTAPPTSGITYYPGMGRLNTIAFDDSDTNTLYVGSPSGGVWKSTNGGSSWAPKGDNFPNMGVSDIVIDPTAPNTLYVATGDYDGNQNISIGVLKSTDAGDTWHMTGLTFGLLEFNLIANLLIDPTNSNTIFATTKNSIKRSTDGGANWTDVFTEMDAWFNDIQYKTGNSTVIYATSYRGKFYKSTDNGGSWSLVSTPAQKTRLDIAQTTDDPNLILALDSDGKINKSTDEGANWTTLSTIKNYESQGSYNMTISISPVDKDLVLVGGVNGWRSKNGGTTWEMYLDGYWISGNSYFYVHSDHHDMKFIPNTNTAFSLNDGGIFKGDASLDAAWTDLSSGLAITQYYNVSGTPQDAGKLIAGAQDNDIAVFDSPTFTGANAGSDGVEGLWDYSNYNIAWTCSQKGIVSRTIDGFSSSTYLRTPEPAPFVWKLDIHPTKPKTIYYGGMTDIYKSSDRGDSWTKLNSGAGSISCISSAPSDGDIMYVAGRNGLRKTTNGGSSWQVITHPQNNQPIKGIAIHPTNPDEIYICYSRYLSGHVYKSSNSGTNWTNISGNLPNVPTYDIDYKTGSTDGELFLATNLGVYYWKNSVGNWTKLDNGLPNVIVHDIEIHYGTEKIRVATYGRGIWEASIKASAMGIEENMLPENSVYLYPNPTKNKNFNIKMNDLTGESNIMIYNLIGSVVKNFKTSAHQISVDLSSFSQGMYIVKITNNNMSISKKLLVK